MIGPGELQKLPLRERLMMMETLWESIAPLEDEIEVPQWHKNLLDEREKLVREGKAKFVDWETAKEQIRKAIL
jgi:putative addiction module component (TIGR02574 family)